MVLGFEQANRYTVLDQDGATVALLAEDLGGLGKAVGRQFLRTRRSFTATVFTPDGAQWLHPTPVHAAASCSLGRQVCACHGQGSRDPATSAACKAHAWVPQCPVLGCLFPEHSTWPGCDW